MTSIHGFGVFFQRGGKPSFSAFFVNRADADAWADCEYLDGHEAIDGGEVRPMKVSFPIELPAAENSTARPRDGRGA